MSTIPNSSQAYAADITTRKLVLVADDEEGILNIAARVIAHLDLIPLPVSDGAAAVEAATRHQNGLVCAILDVQMPVLNGAAAGHAIKQRAPELPIVLMSGGIPEDLTDSVVQLGPFAILHKPFSLTALRELLQRLVAAAQGM